ncbi:hypothetical protein CNMCM5623_005750 [Aspergillus felis]|uniref:Uncharacterized protein n=1 Tax=Aspergillus felis TaxID=1287682 RepID=A0A8H6QKH4_9EURO|nr:hypothetical protein CNMCM5623_005750 [Aspergillus felis]
MAGLVESIDTNLPHWFSRDLLNSGPRQGLPPPIPDPSCCPREHASTWTVRNVWSAPTSVVDSPPLFLFREGFAANALQGNLITGPPPPPAGTPRAQWDAPLPTAGDAWFLARTHEPCGGPGLLP